MAPRLASKPAQRARRSPRTRQLMRQGHMPLRFRRPACPSVTSVRSTRPVALRSLTPGTIVWAHVDFADSAEGKGRPVLVVATAGNAVTVRLISTKARGIRTRVPNWSASGLKRASWFLPDEVIIDRHHIMDVLGHLVDDEDLLAA